MAIRESSSFGALGAPDALPPAFLFFAIFFSATSVVLWRIQTALNVAPNFFSVQLLA